MCGVSAERRSTGVLFYFRFMKWVIRNRLSRLVVLEPSRKRFISRNICRRRSPLCWALRSGLAGYVNGFLTAKSKLPAIIVTLGSMTYLRGIAYVVTGGYPLILTNGFFKNLGQGYVGPVPIPIIMMILVYALFFVVLKYTVFGCNVYMIGGNQEAAHLTGIKVVPRMIGVYTISGICAGIAGIILSGRLLSGQPNVGSGYELDAIAAVVLGGTSLTGGVGTIVGSLFGALFMGVLSNGLTLLSVPYYWQLIIKGAVIVLAIYVDRLRQRNARI